MNIRMAGAALLVVAVPVAEAAVVTVTADAATLRVASSGCADLRDPLTMQVAGPAVCSSEAAEDGGTVLFGARYADAGGDAMRHPWGALAQTQIRDGALEILLRAITGPAVGVPDCAGVPCRVTQASASASFSWSAAFAIAGGGVTLRRTEVPPGFAPFELHLQDLTLGTALDPFAAQWSLADGHRYALDFSQTKIGRDCSLGCTSLAAFAFGPAQIVDARAVPEPGSAGLFGLGLAALLLGRVRVSRPCAAR